MKRRGAIGAAAVAMALAGACLLYGYVQQPAIASPEFSQWAPSALAIRSKIGSADAPAPGMTDDQRREQFCALFKSRFREHTPALAIGVRFVNSDRIKLMCPARLEPFYIDQIALAAWREARADFGKPVGIDIYDTFIGTTQIKIGELRAKADAPEMAVVSYDFKGLELLNRPRSGFVGNMPRNALQPQLSEPLQVHPMRRRLP